MIRPLAPNRWRWKVHSSIQLPNALVSKPTARMPSKPTKIPARTPAGAWGLTAATAHHVRIYRRLGIARIFLANQLVAPADLDLVMAELAASTAHAALWGRTNYGRAFTKFMEQHADALGPKSSLLILGDARSNYSDLALDTLRAMEGDTRHAWWLNPEARRHWDTGDSVAGRYGEIVPMVECRNLTQLGEFVHDIL